jgi:hypothetical protein
MRWLLTKLVTLWTRVKRRSSAEKRVHKDIYPLF